MKRGLVILTALILMLLPLAGFASLAVDGDDDTHYELPVDFTPGQPLDQRFFSGELTYEDPTISVVITKDRLNGKVDYWLADIEIKDPSQLRTMSWDGFDSTGVGDGEVMARRANAVVAIAGDYFSWKGHDLIIRQGVTYLNRLRGNRDILLIDEDGDFHGIEKADDGSVGTHVNGKLIINAFTFGPLLVNNGEIRRGGYNLAMSAEQKCQRMAIAQTGHLKYRIICTGPHKRGSWGLTLEEFRTFVASMPDVIVAYNMDGGDSAKLMFGGVKINDVENPVNRDLADIIYFASAYPGTPDQ